MRLRLVRPRMLDVYIARHVIAGTLVALVALVVLFAFIGFVDDLDNVGKGSYSMTGALQYMLLTMPSLGFNLFPLAALIGTLMGLGTLAASSELVVIRSAGVSVARIIMAVMGAAMVLVVIAMLIGEVVAPWAEQLAQSRRLVALTDQMEMNTRFGFWVRDGDRFINVRKVGAGNDMQGVYIYEFDGARRLRVATHAKRARYEGGTWRLEDIEQSRISEAGVTRRVVEAATWPSLFEPDLVNVISVSPESLSALGLRRYIGYLAENGLDTSRFELALWHKFSYPFATAVMIFLAVPMVLGRLKAVGIGQRVVVGVLVGIAFHVLNQTASQTGLVYGLSAAVSATLPTLLFLGAGLWLMQRVR